MQSRKHWIIDEVLTIKKRIIMKNKYLGWLMAFALFLSGCADLGYTEVVTTDEQWVYDSPIYGIERLVNGVYSHIDYDFGFDDENKMWGQFSRFRGAMYSSATDESDYAQSFSDIHKFYNGGWSSINPFPETWINCYKGIAAANDFLENIHKISIEDYKYNNTGDFSYDVLKEKFELFPYEVRCVRAYLYFELVKTYGDVPIVTTTLTADEANSVTQSPASSVFRFIVDECEAVAEYLPITYADERSKQLGRTTRGMALALKARTLLYAASPLFNKNNDKELWKEAALASKLVIDKCAEWGIQLSVYDKLWGHDNHTNKEMIFVRRVGNINTFERYNYPIGIENGSSGNCPTQNLVDAYEFKTSGKTWFETEKEGLLPSNPYEGLDPRFAMTVVKNGDINWPSYNENPIDITEGGRNAPPLLNATTTGYYLKKYCDPAVDIRNNNPNTRYHSWIVYRLAEFYLNYAEAVYNYLGNADAITAELSMSANEAVNILRSRKDIDMPLFTGSDNFEERYVRERMVELAFEGHRFWDVRRWKKGEEFFTKIYTMRLTKSGDKVIMKRQTKERLWDDRNYLFPIPFTELKKNPNLVQNEGW